MSKIAICLPNSFGQFSTDFVINLLSVVQNFYVWNHDNGDKHSLNVLVNKEGWIDHMREHLAHDAVRDGYDYLMWMDIDQSFPSMLIPDMLDSMEHFPEFEAITGLYTWKTPPYLPHVYSRYNKEDRTFSAAGGFPLKSGFKVEAAGFGCLFIRADVFKKVSEPWFDFKWGHYGEDMYFFRKFIEENGRPVNMACNPLIRCDHFKSMPVSIESYILSNKLEVKDDHIIATQEILDSIDKFHQKLNDSFHQDPVCIRKDVDKPKV